MIIWLTGLPCSGKTTIGETVRDALHSPLTPVEFLDSEAMRGCLWPELGYSEKDRSYNVARLVFLARLLVRHGVTVIVAAVSPRRMDRLLARALCPEGQFIEVHLACAPDICMARDTRGVYEKFRNTGAGFIYEPPTDPELVLRTGESMPGECAARVVAYLRQHHGG